MRERFDFVPKTRQSVDLLVHLAFPGLDCFDRLYLCFFNPSGVSVECCAGLPQALHESINTVIWYSRPGHRRKVKEVDRRSRITLLYDRLQPAHRVDLPSAFHRQPEQPQSGGALFGRSDHVCGVGPEQ